MIVGLGGFGEHRLSIAVSVTLAKVLGAELLGVHVAEPGLAGSLALPGQGLVQASGALRTMDPRGLAKALAALVTGRRRELGRQADELAVSWRFEVAEGMVAPVVLARAGAADVVVLSEGRPRPGLRGAVAVLAPAGDSRLVRMAESLAEREGAACVVLEDDDPERIAAVVQAAGTRMLITGELSGERLEALRRRVPCPVVRVPRRST